MVWYGMAWYGMAWYPMQHPNLYIRIRFAFDLRRRRRHRHALKTCCWGPFRWCFPCSSIFPLFFGHFFALFVYSKCARGLWPKTPSNDVLCLFCLVYAKAALLKFILMPSNVWCLLAEHSDLDS